MDPGELSFRDDGMMEAELTSEEWRIPIRRRGLLEQYTVAVCTLPLDLISESGFTTASEMLCTSHIPQTIDHVQNNVLIIKPSMSQTLRESVV